MATPKFISNIVGPTAKSDLSKLGQAYTLNMFVEKANESQNYVSQVLRPIKGYRKVCDVPGVCRGMYTCSNGYDGHPATYAVFGSELYIIRDGQEPYKVGTMATGSTPPGRLKA